MPIAPPTGLTSKQLALAPPTSAFKVRTVKRPLLSQTTFIALGAVLGIAAYLVGRYVLHVSSGQCRWLLISVLVAGGAPLVLGLTRRLIAGEFGSDLLAGISIITSALLGEYLAGSIVVLMLSGGTALEEYATRRASSVLGALATRMPRIAHRKKNDQVVDVDVAEIEVGEHLVVFPHEVCPADGIVLEGRGSMDESYLTGEPFLIQKLTGAAVLSGALNGETVLTISASKLPSDSRYAKIMRVMEEAEANRPQMRRIADRLGAWYTLFALVVAGFGWILGRTPTRFLAVLVIATPCPLLLAIPVAIIGAISLAASRAIIIKDPSMLERIDTCRTFIFDKTGTLTYGRPALTDVLCAPGVTRMAAMQMATSLEQYSRHPLATSILEAARGEGVVAADVSDISERPGEGLRGHIAGDIVEITGRKNVAPAIASQLPAIAAGMECIILRNGE